MNKQFYPFMVRAEKKTSEAGKDYLAINVSRSYKTKDGERKYENINLVDKRDLLILAEACSEAYNAIVEEERIEYEQKQEPWG